MSIQVERLRRLERKRLVRSWVPDTKRQEAGRPKRFFEVAPEALPLLREQRDTLLAMWEGVVEEV